MKNNGLINPSPMIYMFSSQFGRNFCPLILSYTDHAPARYVCNICSLIGELINNDQAVWLI